MTSLKAPLPDHLDWLTDTVEALVRPGAFVLAGERLKKTGAPLTPAPLGSSFADGAPDVPADASWRSRAKRWATDSAYDGESFVMQLNLEDIPAEVRLHLQTALPTVGVVWVTIDLSGDHWTGAAYFDPRPAADIVWRPRETGARLPAQARWVVQDTMTCATDATLPDISADWREGGLCGDFDAWWQQHYAGRTPSDIQVGGWMNPIQGDHDTERKTLVAAIESQDFGDSGAVYLHHSAERGFFVFVTTH